MAIRHNYLLIAGIVLLAFALRMWGVADLRSYNGDEAYHIPALKTYIETGHSLEWIHPPMKYFLLYGSMKLFGDNPYGWRMKNVLFGTLTIFAVYLLAGALFEQPKIASVAALLFAVDPLHIVLSRSTYGEIPTVFFFVLCVYITVRFVKEEIASPLLAGIFFGIVLADRWYYLIALAVLLTFVLYHKARSTGWLDAMHLLSVYLVLPFGIYLASFFIWFGRGHTLAEFFPLQVDMYRELQSMRLDNFQFQFSKFLPSIPWSWFLKPLISVIPYGGTGSFGNFFVIMNNPFVWLTVLPATAYMAYHAVKYREPFALFVLALFSATYLQFVLVKRPIFIYSALTVLPFAFIAVSYSFNKISESFSERIRTGVYWGMTSAILIVGCYLYPFTTGKAVPVLFYKPLLAIGNTVLM